MGMPNHISGLGGREDIEPLSAVLGMANYIQSYPQNESIQHQTRVMPFGRFGRIGNWLIENI
jgi:hypothetical protein